jgi:Glycosyltransferase Family 4
MRPLSILFTNNTLAIRAGSELWIRDVARALVARGHRPAAFTLVPGVVADELRAATVPIVTDLANFAGRPDLIHGHHHVETLIAALHFPGVPIVHFCHGWVPWEEKPLKHPAIVRYVAVDDTCRDRLVSEEGIPAERVDRLLNFVDLNRFSPRRPLPLRPRRGLILSNHARDDGFVRVIREACRLEGIDVEVAGCTSGRVLDRPELAMQEVDIVFAKARSALEALAVGCSVILADVAGAGPLVTAADLDGLRRANFGIRLLQQPHSVAWYRAQIAAYDPTDATHVAVRVRLEAGLEPAVDRLLEIYARALADFSDRAPTSDDWRCSQRAAARHLSSIAIPVKQAPTTEQRVQALTSDLAAVNALADRYAEELAGAHAQLREATVQIDTLTCEIDVLKREQHAVSERIVDKYEALSILRLRSALMRIPIAGPAARRASRWLAERLTT